MKISVVIPAYNRPDLLLEAIKSVAAQTHLNWEVVIVDDGSSPAIPLDQLKSHLEGNTIFIRHDKPRGVACAKNAGIKAATGEIITLLDDDDLLAPLALERIDEAKHLPVDLISIVCSWESNHSDLMLPILV